MCISFEDDSYLHAVEVDIKMMATRTLEDLDDADDPFPLYMMTRPGYTIYVCRKNSIIILKDGKLQHLIEFMARDVYDKNEYRIGNRWHQEFRHNIYMIDREENLYSIFWVDIEQNTHVVHKLVDSQVEDFYVTGKGRAIVYKSGDLKLPGSIMIDSKTMPVDVKWLTIVGVSNRWIVAGDNKGHAVLAALSTKGLVKSSPTIELTHNANWGEGDPILKYIKVAVERRRCCLMLAFGTDGCCHLISMRSSGQLILVQSIATILDTNVDYDYDNANKTTFLVTDTGIEGQLIMTGYKQINMISLKFK